MKAFLMNKCRICTKVFCCENCRIRHEETIHNVNPECDICLYGRAILHKPSKCLLTHIKNSHWPLHCINCHRVFPLIEELLQHNKCSLPIGRSPQIPGTPVTPSNEGSDQPSPVTPYSKSIVHLYKHFGHITTSTPMQKDTGSDASPIVITPVDHSDIKHKSSIKSGTFNESKKNERRVTFSETPLVENSTKNSNLIVESLDEDGKEENEVHLNDHCENVDFVNDNHLGANFNSEVDIIVTQPEETLYETALNVEFTSQSDEKEESNYLDTLDDFLKKREKIDIEYVNEEVFKESNFTEESDISSSGVWSSMTKAIKSVILGISTDNKANKRSHPENDSLEWPSFKRRKFLDIKCRRPIRNLSPEQRICHVRPHVADKSTQTDPLSESEEIV